MSTTAAAPSMAAAEGQPVTERHARWCREHGHAIWTMQSGVVAVVTGVCPRCGDVTTAAR